MSSLKQLVFATNNPHKLAELRQLTSPEWTILSLSDIDCDEDLPETGSTLKANALQKARYVHDKFGVNCFADDSGLEVDSLDGRPGVYSARYAGPSCNAEDNIEKLLVEMKGIENRSARFRTVICLCIGTENYFFEGQIEGTITEQPEGNNGFGYDPVFRPEKQMKTFAQMTKEEKNSISHRSEAVLKLSVALKQMNH